MASFFAGIRTLTAAQAKKVDLGPLTDLQGKWVNKPIDPKLIAQGWNVIAVPGPKDFVLEVIPYTETLTFSPVVAAGNRGPFVKGKQVQQEITGLLYEQTIVSACPTDFCDKRGFKAGNEIHAERGLFLNVGDPDSGFTVARLSTVPHGNSVLALGNSGTLSPGNDRSFIPPSPTLPTVPSGGPVPLLGYDQPYKNQQFPGVFNQMNPNSFLVAALGSDNITNMTAIVFETNNPDAGGGILNIPFISTNVNASRMNSIFWIEEIAGQDKLQLQYTQSINLVFPPTGTATPIVWPHVTINTMVKV